MFANRIAIVTGGASGIGRAVCQVLAKESASVLVADLELKGANETISSLESGGTHTAVEVDVAQVDSVKNLFDTIRKSYGNDSVAQLIVNCAGITRDSFMVDMTADNFDLVMDVNLRGTFLTTQMACKNMIERKKAGSVVNVSSTSAKIGNMGQANYAASKSAVEGFTKTVAREMGKHNIRCNAVIPGFIDSPMLATVPEKGNKLYNNKQKNLTY